MSCQFDYGSRHPAHGSCHAADPVTPSTIQSIVVQLSVQDTPSASGLSCMLLISMPPAAPTAPTAVPLISISPTAPTAKPLLPIMSVRPNQMGYLTGAPSGFYAQVTQFPYMSNPSWEVSQTQREFFTKSAPSRAAAV